jgi:signal transduction histidine kinase
MMATTMMMATTTTEVPDRGRRRLSPSFRLRVLGLVAVILVVSVAVGLFVQRAVLIERFEQQVEESLDQERRELESLAGGRDPDTGEPFAGDVVAIFDTFLNRNFPSADEVYLAIVDGEPFRVTRAPVRLEADRALVARWAALTEGERGWVSTNAGRLRYLAVPLRFEGRTRGVFVVGYFVQPERDDIDGATRVEAIAALAVVAVAVGAAWLVAGRLLKPVRDLTASARRISETDLSSRIEIEGDDEIAELGRTFNAMLDRLSGGFESQRRFVAVAGHELRTPITVIRGHLELMGDDPEDRREAVAVATEELDRMARIVDDLLMLATVEQPGFLRVEPTEISDLTTELLAKARHLGDREWTFDGSAEGEIPVDPQRLTQAALNLARNAVEHSSPGDQIGIGSDRDGVSVRIWVRDQGAGIEPEDQERVFDRFVRGGKGARRSSGAGLGLSLVRAIVEAHGGRVDLVSAPGVGSTFTLVLPAPSDGGGSAGRQAGAEDPTLVQPGAGQRRRSTWPGS